MRIKIVMIYDEMCMYTCMCMHLGHSSDVKTVAISPDGKYIVSGSEDRCIKVWDLSSGREIHTFKGKTYLYSYTSIEIIFILCRRTINSQHNYNNKLIIVTIKNLIIIIFLLKLILL